MCSTTYAAPQHESAVPGTVVLQHGRFKHSTCRQAFQVIQVHIIARPMQPHELPSYRPRSLAARRDHLCGIGRHPIRSRAAGFLAPQSRLSRTWTGGHFPSRVETPSTSYRKPPCVSVVVSKCTPVQRPASDIACKVLIRSKHLYSSLQCTCIEMMDSASSFVDSIVVVSGACAVYNVLMRL